MIIEKPIGAAAVTNKTNFEWFIDIPNFSTHPLILPISVHPVCDYFFLIFALCLLATTIPGHLQPALGSFSIFFCLFSYPGKDVLLTFISYVCNNHLEHERKTSLLCFRHFHNAFSFKKSRYIPYAFDLDVRVENVVGYNISYTRCSVSYVHI